MKKALIIGGGFAGCAMAHQFALKGGWDVLLVEQGPELGAGVRTRFYGGHPYTFGPRHFLTKNESVYAYLDNLIPMRKLDHRFITYVEKDDQFYQYPIHVTDIPNMPEANFIKAEIKNVRAESIAEAKNLEDYWIASVGSTLYQKFVDGYSKKMWRLEDNKQIDDFAWSPKGVALKTDDSAAWSEAISAYPLALNGYNDYFAGATSATRIRLSTEIQDYNISSKKIRLDGSWSEFDIIVSTISPDLIFKGCYGALPYIGRDIHLIMLPIEHAFPENTYFVYYAGQEKHTRAVEYKKFTQYESKGTLIGLEIPSSNGRHYPLPIRAEQDKAKQYFDIMPEGVFSIGRAGSYRYQVDIDDCIEQAMDVATKL